jgi:hypothetical protein
MENQNDNETQAACGVDSSDLMDDLLWRLKDIREDLMSTGLGGRLYNCDEWSTPTVNLASAIRVIEKLKEELATENHRLRIALPPLPKKEILKAPERREIRGYTAAQMMDYADAAVAATREQNNH